MSTDGLRVRESRHAHALDSVGACSSFVWTPAGKCVLLGVLAFLLVVVGVARGAEANSGRGTLTQQAPPVGALIVNDNAGGVGQPAACATPDYTGSDIGQATDSASAEVAPAGSVIYVC